MCGGKRDAERGIRFVKLPKYLPVILRRFNFDLERMERVKVNDRVGFPFVVNMNEYMGNWEDIKGEMHHLREEEEEEVEKALEQELKTLTSTPPPSSSSQPPKKTFLRKRTNMLPNNIKNKPLPETRSFLKDMRKKTGKKKDITIEIESGNQMMTGEALEEELIQAAIKESLGMVEEVKEVEGESKVV